MDGFDPDFDRPAPANKAADDPRSVAGSSCLGWGVVSMLTWWLPLFGQVFALAGLVRGVQARGSPERARVQLGLTLALLALALSATGLVCLIQAMKAADF